MERHWRFCNGCGAQLGPLPTAELVACAAAELGWTRQGVLDLCPRCPEVRRRRMVSLPLPVIEELE